MVEKAENFCLKDENEEEVCLNDLLKSHDFVVLYFYPKDNTPGCTTEAVEFTQLIEEFSRINAVVVGVSADTCESHKKFKIKHNLSIKLLADPNKEVIKKFGAYGKKKMYGKEIEGIIRSTFIINKDFEIVKSWRNVRAKGHAEQVLSFLKEITHGSH